MADTPPPVDISQPAPPDGAPAAAPAPRKRIASLDAFRGFTILGMVFVIAVAAGGYQHAAGALPQQLSWFGSIPVSTWFHADVAYHLWEASFRAGLETEGLDAAAIDAAVQAAPQHNLRNIGVTFTDLIAPWFVFIVGACVPISRVGKAPDWLGLAFRRALVLILVGILYIALVIQQVTWWWGVLQAIGVAYFMAAVAWRLPQAGRWAAIFLIGGANLILTETVPGWTEPGWTEGAFGTLANPEGNWLKPLIVHCWPWLSISYGVMAMIGVLLGDALASRDDRQILRQSLLVGGIFTILGYAIHLTGFLTENYSLAFNKPIVTTSYAFFTAGLGALAYAGFYWVMDVKGWKAWAAPLVVFGMNPLLAYFLMIVLRRGLESLGLIHFFHRLENTGLYGPDGYYAAFRNAEGLNLVVYRWAEWFGGGEASQAVLWFFQKGGYTGMAWGLAYTAILWVIVWWCNRRGVFWKL